MNKFIKTYVDAFDGITKDIWIFASMMLINRLGTLILPFLTLYTTQELGWSKIDAGTATMSFGVGSLAGAILGGYLTDKIGYYRTMMISLFAASGFFYSLQFVSDFYMLCGLLFMSSMMSDLLRPALMTGITYFTTKKTQTRAVSLMRMAFNLGISVGPAFAGVLIEQYGYSLIFTVDAVTCLCAGGFLILFVTNVQKPKLKEKNVSLAPSKSPYKDFKFLVFMFFSFCMLVSFFQMLFTVPLFMTEELGYTEKHVGYFYGVNGMLIFLTEMPLVHYLEQRYDNFKVMTMGAWLIGIAILIFIFPLPAIVLIGFYTVFVSYGEIINFPFIASTSMNRASEDNIGQYMSVNTVMFSMSLIVAPILGTGILEAFGYDVLFIVMFLLCLLSVVGLSYIKKDFITETPIIN